MELTWQSIITAGGVLSALLVAADHLQPSVPLDPAPKGAGRRTEGHPQGEHAADLRRAGLPQRHGRAGLQRPVREAIDKIEKSLNLRAHDQ